MKIRCEHNSIRLRLRKSELARLGAEHNIQESITFPSGQKLTYAISIREDISEINPLFYRNNIEIHLPMILAQEWIATNRVGIDCTIELADDSYLELLIEKDFTCLDRPNEDKADTFIELVPKKSDPC